MAIDVKTPVGQVRLLISDVGGEDGSTFLFEEDEIEAFLTLEQEDVFAAAATALRTVAANEAQTLKAITVLELETRGDKVAGALEKLADKLDERSDAQYSFDFARMDVDIFSRRELRAIVRSEMGFDGEDE